MFKRASSTDYSYPVVIERVGDGGRLEKLTFDVRFKRLTQQEIEDLTARSRSDEIDDQGTAEAVLVGWKGVQDEDGAELVFSGDNRDLLFTEFGVRAAVVRAWFESLTGAKRKN